MACLNADFPARVTLEVEGFISAVFLSDLRLHVVGFWEKNILKFLIPSFLP
jgi:hypothetical protein